ncbi:MAG: hypothetical protein ACLTXR_08075 [Clostridia bacterium]
MPNRSYKQQSKRLILLQQIRRMEQADKLSEGATEIPNMISSNKINKNKILNS